MIDDMIAWLTAQLDDDERIIREADAAGPEPGTTRDLPPEGIWAERMDLDADERWLAEIAAKRKRIEHYRQVAAYANPDNRLCMDSATWQAYVLGEGAARRSLQFDAEVYAARPGWRDEWRP